jgi:hypothetical protein
VTQSQGQRRFARFVGTAERLVKLLGHLPTSEKLVDRAFPRLTLAAEQELLQSPLHCSELPLGSGLSKQGQRLLNRFTK